MEKEYKRIITVAVVDDNDNDRKISIDTLKRYEQERQDITFDIETFNDGNKFLSSNVYSYDIVFMDMIMPSIDGIETATSLRKISNYTNIIIISSSPNYAIKGYSVDAIGYVLKPINYTFIKTMIDKCISNIKKDKESFIIVNGVNEKRLIYIKEILYVEVIDHDLFVHTDGEKFKIRLTLDEFNNKYGSLGFSKCHRCFLVNLKHVKSFNGTDVFVGPYKLPISRLRKKQFEKEFYEYLGASL